MATIKQAFPDSDDGTYVGNDSSSLMGFWGVTPIVQPSGADQAALTLTTVTSSGFGFVGVTGASAAVALIGAMRTALVNAGIMKGSA